MDFLFATGAKGSRPIGYNLIGKERTVKINDVKRPLSVFAKSVSWHKRSRAPWGSDLYIVGTYNRAEQRKGQRKGN